MSEAKFTPAPWEVHPDCPDMVRCSLGVVAEMYLDRGQNETNSHLIAAAPDLYDVLQELEESVDYWSEYDVPLGIQDRIRNVLRKARGEHE